MFHSNREAIFNMLKIKWPTLPGACGAAQLRRDTYSAEQFALTSSFESNFKYTQYLVSFIFVLVFVNKSFWNAICPLIYLNARENCIVSLLIDPYQSAINLSTIWPLSNCLLLGILSTLLHLFSLLIGWLLVSFPLFYRFFLLQIWNPCIQLEAYPQ